MLTVVRSVRDMMGIMPAMAAASINALAGKQNRYSVPSIFRMFAMAVFPCIYCLLISLPEFSA